MKTVILAGGSGTRLRPYTLVLPKPLMPVGEMPVLEILLRWLRRSGVCEVYLATGYLGQLIRSLCGDGSQWGLKIHYCQEKEPLGTVGPLKVLKDGLDETFMVVNGDLITDLDIRSFRKFHKEKGGIMTVGVFNKPVKVDMGVIEGTNGVVSKFREKPSINFLVSMGVYCMEPEILEHIPAGVAFGFDDLILTLLDKNIQVNKYKHDGFWMDIGRPADFQEAQEQFGTIRQKILGS